MKFEDRVERWKMVARMREEGKHTFIEIGAVFDCTREYARQLYRDYRKWKREETRRSWSQGLRWKTRKVLKAAGYRSAVQVLRGIQTGKLALRKVPNYGPGCRQDVMGWLFRKMEQGWRPNVPVVHVGRVGKYARKVVSSRCGHTITSKRV